MEKAKLIIVVGKNKAGYFSCPLCDGEAQFCWITMGDCAIENDKINHRTYCPLSNSEVVIKMGDLMHEDYINTKAEKPEDPNEPKENKAADKPQ